MPLSGIHNFSQLEAGFPIRIASGMTVLGTGGRLVLIRLFFRSDYNQILSDVIRVLIFILLRMQHSGMRQLWKN
jgi:hypothetical protein